MAAQMAYDCLQGKPPSGTTSTVKNDTKDVPSVLLTPVEVTKDNVKDTVIKDEFWTVDQICTGEYAKACQRRALVGIKNNATPALLAQGGRRYAQTGWLYGSERGNAGIADGGHFQSGLAPCRR